MEVRKLITKHAMGRVNFRGVRSSLCKWGSASENEISLNVVGVIFVVEW